MLAGGLLCAGLCHMSCGRGCLGGQYPGEKEITFPPFTGLEADGDPRVERTEGGGEVVIFPLKVQASFARPLCSEIA